MEAVENTLVGFHKAVELGVDIIETDVRMTKDKEIIVFHDEDFMRTCNDARKVRDVNLADVPEFAQEIPLSFKPGQSYKRDKICQAKITTLRAVFEKLPRETIIQIEIKDSDSEEATLRTISLVKEYHRQKTTILGHLTQEYNQLIRTKEPSIATFASWKDIGNTMILLVTGLLPFMSVPYDVLSAPYLTRDLAIMRDNEHKKTGSSWPL